MMVPALSILQNASVYFKCANLNALENENIQFKEREE